MRSVLNLGKLNVSALSIFHGSELHSFQHPSTVVSTDMFTSLFRGKMLSSWDSGNICELDGQRGGTVVVRKFI